MSCEDFIGTCYKTESEFKENVLRDLGAVYTNDFQYSLDQCFSSQPSVLDSCRADGSCPSGEPVSRMMIYKGCLPCLTERATPCNDKIADFQKCFKCDSGENAPKNSDITQDPKCYMCSDDLSSNPSPVDLTPIKSTKYSWVMWVIIAITLLLFTLAGVSFIMMRRRK